MLLCNVFRFFSRSAGSLISDVINYDFLQLMCTYIQFAFFFIPPNQCVHFLQYMRDSCGAKCSLPFSSNTQNGSLGETGIYSHPS